MSGNVRVFLFVAGNAPSGVRALAQLQALLDKLGADRGLVERVNVLSEPQRALDANLIATPALQLIAEGESRVYVGDITPALPELERLLG